MLKFDRQGLIPAVIQDEATNEVLMVAFMNEEALQKTRDTGYTHFYSRSRQTIWHKGEQSGNVQEVCDIRLNCEENSLLIRVKQHGGAACHDGYRSCYYRRLQPDDSYMVIAERVFDPAEVYHHEPTEGQTTTAEVERNAMEQTDIQIIDTLEREMRQLYQVYLYLRDHDMSQQSHTSRLLQERSHGYLAARLADELEELANVQSGEHMHTGRQPDTILEGSQVGYWLLLLAATAQLSYDDFSPHQALLDGYNAHLNDEKAIELMQDCLSQFSTQQHETLVRGLQQGFTFIGWACEQAQVSILAPTEFDLEQMRRKGLVQ